MTPRIQTRTLLRVLGIGFGIAVVVGGVVGQGIMRAPGIVAAALPSAQLILLAWLAGGLMAMIDAFALVELGASVPRAGGPYALAARAFGPFAGTLVGWADWLQGVTVVAFVSVVFAEYVHRLGFLSEAPISALAIGLIAILFALNWTSTRTSGASQSIGSLLKGLGLIVFIVLLLASPGGAEASEAAPVSPTLSLAAVAIGMRAVYNTYAGWTTSVYFCEEIHSPERNIARATFGGIAIVTALYVLVNAAMLHALTPQQMAASNLPAADAAAQVLGQSSGTFVTVLAIVSVVAIANLFLMFLSRIGFAMARDGALPAVFAGVSSSGTPRVSLAVTAAAAALLTITGGYEQLIAMAVPVTAIVVASMDLAAIRMRYREPELARPFRMPLFPLPAVLGLLVNAALIAAVFYEDPIHSSLGLALVAVIGVVYKIKSARFKKVEI
jgi:APA family basic amino acid/polyamine antiporter